MALDLTTNPPTDHVLDPGSLDGYPLAARAYEDI